MGQGWAQARILSRALSAINHLDDEGRHQRLPEMRHELYIPHVFTYPDSVGYVGDSSARSASPSPLRAAQPDRSDGLIAALSFHNVS